MAPLLRPPWLFLTVAIYLLLASVLYQTGLDSTLEVSGYAGLVLGGILYPKFGMALVLTWLTWTLYDFAGSSHPGVDIILLSVAFIAAALVILCGRQRRFVLRWPGDLETLAIVGLFLPFAWVLLSIGDAVTAPRLALKTSSPASRKQTEAPAKVKVGLAISGGGYRAALFHAGVVAALEELNDPVEVMTSVSGGSIFASFYARGGTPQQFVDLIVQGSMRLERYMLRLDNALCLLGSVRMPAGMKSYSLLPFFPECSRTSLQSDLLRQNFLGDTLAKAGPVAGRPELMLGMTDIAGNRMMGVTPSGFVNIWLHGPLERFSFGNPAGIGNTRNQASFFPEHLAHLPGEQRLASLVAASGAFPGALPSYRLRLPYTVKDHAASSFTYLLADGGLTDNSGIVLLDAGQLLAIEAQHYIENPYPDPQNPPSEWHIPRWNIDLILASDASAYSTANLPGSAFAEFVQAMDVANGNAGGADMFAVRGKDDHSRPPILLLSPRSITPDPVSIRGRHLTIVLPGVEGFQVGNKQFSVPVGITEDTLWFIADHMDEDHQEETDHLLAGLVESGVITEGGIDRDMSQKLLASRDRAGLEALKQLDRLTALVREEFERRLIVFIRTPTLRDQIDQATAKSIFILGKYIVQVNQRYIKCYLTNLEAAKQSLDHEDLGACRSYPGDMMNLLPAHD